MPKKEEDEIILLSVSKPLKKKQLDLIHHPQNPKFQKIKNTKRESKKSTKKNILIRNINLFKYYYFILTLIDAITQILLSNKSYFEYKY